jgi:GNAT superfamily N-acetyltransferase
MEDTMIEIRKLENKDEITKITLDIMNALPEWFSPPEYIKNNSIIHREFPFFVAFDGIKAIGFLTLKIHNKYTADIYNMGVLKEYHRQGIGGLLLSSAESYCRDHDFIYLTVKTLDESEIYEPYNGTRAFYYKNGFIPLEVFKAFWNERNPCLFLSKYLRVR